MQKHNLFKKEKAAAYLMALALLLQNSSTHAECAPDIPWYDVETRTGKHAVLIASMHAISSQDWALSKELRLALKEASVIEFEFDIGNPDVVRQIADLRISKGDATESEQAIRSLLLKEVHGGPGALAAATKTFNGLTLFGLAALLSPPELNDFPGTGTDVKIRQIAQAQHVSIKGLLSPREIESAHQQITLDNWTTYFNGLIDLSKNNSLRKGFINYNTELSQGYLNGDLTAMERTQDEMNKDFPGIAHMAQTTANVENPIYDSKVESEIGKQANPIFVIGAAHFWGTSGLLLALQRSGMIIKRAALCR